MEIEKAKEILRLHNKWRRDNHVPSVFNQQDPAELGIAIDTVIEFIDKTI